MSRCEHPAAAGNVLSQTGLSGAFEHPADVQLSAGLNAQGRGGVGVRIKIHHQGGDAGREGRGRQTGGHGRLSHSTFEAADADYLHLKTQNLTPVAVSR